MFFRYRHKEAAGPGPWEYIDWTGFEHDLMEYLTSCESWRASEHNDLYRGVDIEKIDLPPREWLISEAREAKELARSAMARSIRYLELLMGVTP